MEKFIDLLVQSKYQRLIEWRAATERDSYPLKLSKNLLYEGLTILGMWKELKKSFNTFGFFGERDIYNSFTDAHNYIFIRRRQIQTENILPILDKKYIEVNELPYLKFSSFRERSENAYNGTSAQIEEIEFTYFFHTAAYELIYGWSAAGLMGMSKKEAFQSISTAIWEGVDYNILDAVVEAFGKTTSMFYKPLPDY